ncbi:hypothetical protein EYZ11_008373 [Aspergillus tanneri]|uniref:Uncharacterized protein n=1 Tax=Aspergillus tanneri TaxID=1220188 RepID=A0A4S3JCU6_9EURO|nr:hypothetical protein EYZ11_008373 [Aspergillus tanneri]
MLIMDSNPELAPWDRVARRWGLLKYI